MGNKSKSASKTEELSDEMQSLLTMMRHRMAVQHGLNSISSELEKRAIVHDESKFRLDEFDGFVRVNAAARKHEFGSDELKAVLKSETCVDLHKGRNAHHPEHHDDIANMSFLDIIEMTIDWWAASVTYGQTKLKDSLPVLLGRYEFTEGQVWLIKQVVKWLSA